MRLVLAWACLLATPAVALAHAHLQTANPAPSSTVTAAPSSVSIDFTEGVEPQFSAIAVQDANGHPVTVGTADVAPGNNKRLFIKVDALPAGTYRVIWHATAVDTHKTQGTYEFTVQP